MDTQHYHKKRHRSLISCTECHRRKQKCDRRQPCQNCVKRSKSELCRFEKHEDRTYGGMAVDTDLNSSGENGVKFPAGCARLPSLPKTNQLSPLDYENLVSVLGYSTHDAHSTLSVVNRVGSTDSLLSSPPGAAKDSCLQQTALDDKYRSLVRQLPSKEHIETLVQQFFEELNWHYDVLDEINFYEQLESWRRFPYSAHSHAVSSLPADMLAFPSLVFQLMAHSLIHQPVGERASSSLDSLKYAPGMTFVDVAYDFSEAGFSMIETVEKKDMSMVAVQAGILRAAFLKHTGRVIDAWHVIGTSIRNAQEIGLHTNVAAKTPLVSIDAHWDDVIRRRVWFVLHNWDIHMAVVLGRPTSTTMAGETVEPPQDLAQRQHGKPPQERTWQDAPTPSTVVQIGYNTAYRYFVQIRELENRGARIDDYDVVRKIHAAIEENINRLPGLVSPRKPRSTFRRISSLPLVTSCSSFIDKRDLFRFALAPSTLHIQRLRKSNGSVQSGAGDYHRTEAVVSSGRAETISGL